MRVLFLTNLYPPLSSGGYEQWCEEAAEGLRARGYDIRVLTTRPFRELTQADPPWVQRELYMEMDFGTSANSLSFFTRRQAREQHNLDCLRRQIETLKPERVLIWGMWNLPRSLAALAEAQMPGRVVYYMGDYWPTLPTQHKSYWEAPARNWRTWVPKAVLKPFADFLLEREPRPALHFERVLFPSRFMQQEFERLGVPVQSSQVVPGAIDTAPYARQPHKAFEPGKLSLLYAGRLSPEKGIETAIAAAGSLVQDWSECQVSLTIVGGGETAYQQHLAALARRHGIESAVTFRPPVTKEGMPALYSQFDVYLFPSIWNEPFGRVLVEAMASGVAVVGAETGGAAEIMEDGVNALTFPPGDAQALAQAVRRLGDDGELRQRLVQNGRRTAVEKYDIRRMVEEIDDYLVQMLEPVEAAV
jgi:glycogen synthase